MTQSALQYASSRNDDEIDLLELFRLLWQKKVVILAFVLAATLLALAYAFTAAEKWTSIAYVRAPRVEQLKAYLEQRRALARVTGNKPVDIAALSNKLFNDFIQLSATEQVKHAFFLGSPYYKNQTQEAEEQSSRSVLHRLADKDLQIKAPGKNEISPSYTLSFTAANAGDAQGVLTAYIDAVNRQALALVDREFGDSLNAGVLSRQAEASDIEFQVEHARKRYIADLEAALSTARNAGIKEYTVGQHLPGSAVIELRNVDRLFMLGEKYLSAELATAKDSPLLFPPRYYELKRELQMLEPMLEYLAAPSDSYSYQLAPTLPLSREAPKRSLIVVLGVILGGMLGCGWVLVTAALRRPKHQDARPPGAAV